MNEEAMLDLVKELIFVKHTADWQTCDVAAQELLRQQREIESLRAQLAARVPYVGVPLNVLEDASAALGNFCSDLGWADSDMQAMDNLDAVIARHKATLSAAPSHQAPVAQGEPFGFMNAGHVHELQQGRIPYGYVYQKAETGASVAVFTTHQQASKPMTDEQAHELLEAMATHIEAIEDEIMSDEQLSGIAVKFITDRLAEHAKDHP